MIFAIFNNKTLIIHPAIHKNQNADEVTQNCSEVWIVERTKKKKYIRKKRKLILKCWVTLWRFDKKIFLLNDLHIFGEA